MTTKRSRRIRLAWALAPLAAASLALVALNAPSAAAKADPPLQLVFVYSSEKKDWLDEVYEAYKATNPAVNGQPVTVKLVPMGSGETVEAVLSGAEIADEKGNKVGPPVLLSPASEAYLILGNEWAVNGKEGKPPSDPKTPIVAADHPNLVLSPVVVAMWKPMAEALGWPNKPVSWKTLRDLALNKDGWGSLGHPEWGAFKLGHTHAEKSNSGLLALLEEVYAAAGKKQGLTVKDVEAGTGFLTDLERAVVHYHTSTGFLTNTMRANGPDYFSAAVTYENLVVDANRDPKLKLPYPLVAIYPEEGTFISDHPVAVVQRPWVSDDLKKAAEDYIAFLRKPEQQATALKHGFRPALDNVAVGDPINAANGADPAKPGPGGLLRPPAADVMQAALNSWRQHKKHARVIIAFDDSKSMGWQNGKLQSAKAGAQTVVDALGLDPENSVGLLVFDNALDTRNAQPQKMTPARKEQLTKAIAGIEAGGQTALYDAAAAAYDQLQQAHDPDDISAIILLTDGVDYVTDPSGNPAGSKVKLEELLDKVKVDAKKDLTLIYTIAYGSEDKDHGGADLAILEKIAAATRAKSWRGTKNNIDDVMKEVLKYF